MGQKVGFDTHKGTQTADSITDRHRSFFFTHPQRDFFTTDFCHTRRAHFFQWTASREYPRKVHSTGERRGFLARFHLIHLTKMAKNGKTRKRSNETSPFAAEIYGFHSITGRLFAPVE